MFQHNKMFWVEISNMAGGLDVLKRKKDHKID